MSVLGAWVVRNPSEGTLLPKPSRSSLMPFLVPAIGFGLFFFSRDFTSGHPGQEVWEGHASHHLSIRSQDLPVALTYCPAWTVFSPLGCKVSLMLSTMAYAKNKGAEHHLYSVIISAWIEDGIPHTLCPRSTYTGCAQAFTSVCLDSLFMKSHCLVYGQIYWCCRNRQDSHLHRTYREVASSLNDAIFPWITFRKWGSRALPSLFFLSLLAELFPRYLYVSHHLQYVPCIS